ncbi:nitrilase-related carbon-nitrogen hydrolase [Roseibium algae]|uniref:Nitrilase-related carbon-nitrogen hydrolase n=1 Tax=Roseibium algae TaxID=3123038 RepID=A0ABU8TLB9_9HYPH
MQDYAVALWALNLGFAPDGCEAFAAHVEARMREARDGGAKLLVLPEYAVEACLSFKPAGLKPTEEMDFLAKVGLDLLELLRPLPAKYGVSLLAGSMPIARGAGHSNTAVLLTADGREIRQDKMSLTPGEMDPEAWQLQGGQELKTFELDGLKVAILICLDVEMPALSCLLARERLDLLLVPSMTEMLSGYHRVFDCAKARAIELMTCVAVCGTVGRTPGTTQIETNVSGASLFTPCEEALGFKGVAASIAPTRGDNGENPFLFVTVPVGKVRQLRDGEAEVWPGAWTAGHIVVTKTD